MNFWDSSALLPLIIQEKSSNKMLHLFKEEKETDHFLIWTLTSVEVASTLCRLQRTGQMDKEDFEKALQSWIILSRGCHVVRDVEGVKQRAIRLLRTHSLKAADSLQLAAALISVSDVTSNHRFVTLDQKLTEAATCEGFEVLPK